MPRACRDPGLEQRAQRQQRDQKVAMVAAATPKHDRGRAEPGRRQAYSDGELQHP